MFAFMSLVGHLHATHLNSLAVRALDELRSAMDAVDAEEIVPLCKGSILAQLGMPEQQDDAFALYMYDPEYIENYCRTYSGFCFDCPLCIACTHA